jgi:hypothetical protein
VSKSSGFKQLQKQPASRTATPQTGPSSNTISKPSTLSPEELRQWEHGMMTRIFKTTLDVKIHADHPSKNKGGIVRANAFFLSLFFLGCFRKKFSPNTRRI